MAIWRINARIVPNDPNIKSFDLNPFYLDCLAKDLERDAMAVVAKGRKDCRINLSFGPLENPRLSTAKKYVQEGIWLDGLNEDDAYVYTEMI